jgi:hypothetical protein
MAEERCVDAFFAEAKHRKSIEVAVFDLTMGCITGLLD